MFGGKIDDCKTRKGRLTKSIIGVYRDFVIACKIQNTYVLCVGLKSIQSVT